MDTSTLQNGPRSTAMTYFITYGFIYHDNILSASCATVQQRSFFIAAFMHLKEMKESRGCFDCVRGDAELRKMSPVGITLQASSLAMRPKLCAQTSPLGPRRTGRSQHHLLGEAAISIRLALSQDTSLFKGLFHFTLCTTVFYIF